MNREPLSKIEKKTEKGKMETSSSKRGVSCIPPGPKGYHRRTRTCFMCVCVCVCVCRIAAEQQSSKAGKAGSNRGNFLCSVPENKVKVEAETRLR
jgi:hypothetical protein